MYYLLSFASTHDGIATKMRLRNRVNFLLLPTPREISSSCGISIRLAPEDYQPALALLEPRDLEQGRVHTYCVTEHEEGNVYEQIALPVSDQTL